MIKPPTDLDAEKRSQEALHAWMSKPETKLILSLLPPCESNPDAQRTLLESCFRRGFDSGMVFILTELVARQFTDMKKD
jgi:hypothetical protein